MYSGNMKRACNLEQKVSEYRDVEEELKLYKGNL